MKRPFLLLCLLSLLFFQDRLSGQILREFSADSTEFPVQFREYMERYMKEDEMAVVNDFISFWSSPERSPEYRAFTHQMLNALLAKRGRPKPHFITLLYIMKDFQAGTAGEENRKAWESGFMAALGNPKQQLRYIERFLDNTHALLTEGVLNSSSSVTWKATSPRFQILFTDSLIYRFDETDLWGYAQRDSEMISGTRGNFNPLTLTWTGEGGRVSWERAGFGPDEVYARLRNYSIDMSRSEYQADSVDFYYPEYFEKPMLGVLNEKIKNIISPDRATHPQFDSYERRTFIKNLYDNIDFDGGFSMQGARLNGSGDETTPASLFIYHGDTLVLHARSDFFVFRKDRVNSARTETTIYIGKDSIYHPEIYFTYGIDKRELSLMQTQDLMTQSPYFNSLQRMDMTVEQLAWKIDEPVIRLTMLPGTSMGSALFQSENYFKESHYRHLQGIDDNNPLALIRRFSEWYYSETFPAQEFANWMHKPVEQVRQTLIRLATEGFVYYDQETDEATIKEKLHNYLNASSGRIDYDVISIQSEVRSPDINGSLDLRTYDLTVNGVGAIFLSDSQNVAIIPSGNRIILQENRNFQFDGRLEAGLFTFYGQQFHFDYDSFKISMPAIDSIALRLEEKNPETGQTYITEVKNKIEVASGELLIDKANNKSGLDYDPQYPIFSTIKKAYVYYSGKIPGDTTHTRENGIRFEINPFTIYELDHFTRADVEFEGDFESEGILPSFKQTLRMQKDYSLGFVHEVPEEGFPVYGGKGRIYNKVDMSNEGLRAAGKLTHLGATVHADQFLFYPDSMVTLSNQFEIARQTTGTEYPDVRSESVKIRWFPKEDDFLCSSGPTPFDLFQGKASMRGTLNLSTDKLGGDGLLAIDQARLTSRRFVLRSSQVLSDSIGLVMLSPDGSSEYLAADDLSTGIDVNQGKGNFRSNEDYTRVEFPRNRYFSFANNMDWNISGKEILLEDRPGAAVSSNALLAAERDQRVNWYISAYPGQDSLAFRSTTTRYKLGESVIYAEGVEKMDVADAVLVPDARAVTIDPNARIRTLKNAEVNVFSGEVRHRFYEASIDVMGAREYFGSGKYDYIDRDATSQVIFMDDISVDTAYHTVAKGTVSESDPLLLNPWFEFAGKVSLDAGSPYLTFDGGARPQYDCPGIARNYIGFEARIDPMDVRIPVTEDMRAMNNVRIYTGHYITNDSIHIYPAFFSSRKNYSDIPISHASGYLWYDEDAGQYQVGSLERRADPSLAEPFISLDRNYCKLYGEGPLDLGIDMGQVQITSLGDINTNLETGETELHVMLGLNFFFSEEALTAMSTEIRAIPTLQVLNMKSEGVRKRLALLLGKSSSDRVMEELSLYGVMNEMPEAMNFSLLLSDVTLVWNPATNSYRSVGKIGIGNIGKVPVNVMVDGNIEIQKKRSGDMMDIYLEIDKNSYYYFGYTRGVMQSISSNNLYRDILTGLSVNQRTMDTKGKGTPYIYMIAVDRKMSMFLRRIRENINEEEPPETPIR